VRGLFLGMGGGIEQRSETGPRKTYGFQTFKMLQVALYHALYSLQSAAYRLQTTDYRLHHHSSPQVPSEARKGMAPAPRFAYNSIRQARGPRVPPALSHGAGP